MNKNDQPRLASLRRLLALRFGVPHGSLGEKSNCESRAMNLNIRLVEKMGHLSPCKTFKPNTTTNTILELHPRTHLSPNSNHVIADRHGSIMLVFTISARNRIEGRDRRRETRRIACAIRMYQSCTRLLGTSDTCNVPGLKEATPHAMPSYDQERALIFANLQQQFQYSK